MLQYVKGRARLAVADGIRLAFAREAADLPVPPARLMSMVMGDRRPAGIAFRYTQMGKLAADDIRAILFKNNLAIEKFEKILDFGCGCGRVIRYWHDLPGEVVGTDYNPDLIRWNVRHLPFSFDVNHLDPPLRYADATFDFAYALSVFTHLDEERQNAWRDELLRVLRPGGFLLFSTHGSRFRGRLGEKRTTAFDDGKVVYMGRARSDAGENMFGTYQSEEQVRRHFAAGIEIIDHVPWGALGLGGQDLWLTRKPANA